jgi:hypothetical protein
MCVRRRADPPLGPQSANGRMVSSLTDPLTPPPPTSTPQDKLTSVVIPMAFAATGMALLVKGLDDLSWGKNRKEGF